MQTAGKNEEKRNKTWQIVMTAATILIIIVAIFFLYRGFFGNPLEGKWLHDESDMTLEIRGRDTAVLTSTEVLDGKKLEVTLSYTMDKKAKQITFKTDSDALAKAAESIGSDVTASDVRSAVSSMITSFNYNLESNELTLTEWDYGDQLLFTRVR